MIYLGENIRWLRLANNLSQEEFASLIGAKRSSIYQYESNGVIPPIEVIQKLAKNFGITIDDLINKKLKKGQDSESVLLLKEPKTEYRASKGQTRFSNVLVPVSAQAGYMSGWTQEWIDQNLEYIHIPAVDYEARTFEVAGDSMEPVLRAGDYIVCSKVEAFADIKPDAVYCVIDKEIGITVKFAETRSKGLVLRSANTAYGSFFVEYMTVFEVWKANVLITSNFSPKAGFEDTARLQKIEDFIRQKFPDSSI